MGFKLDVRKNKYIIRDARTARAKNFASADKRKKPEKIQRIESVSPLWERGCVFYSEKLKDNPDHIAGLEQTLALCRGSRAHDDAPDADEGAIFILQQHGRRTQIREPLMAAPPENDLLW